MRVLLIGNFAPDRQESMLRIARLVATGLRDQGHEVSTWSPEPRLVKLLPRYRYGGPAKYLGYFDKFVLFPRRVRRKLLRERRADVVHIVDHANAVYAPLFAGQPLLAMCHDLLQIRAARGEFSQHQLSGLGRRYQSWILDHIAQLPHVVAPSTQTIADLQRLANLPANRITLIPHALTFPYHRCTPSAARLAVGLMLREHHLPPGALEHGGRGFLLNIGGGQWYKNRCGLLDIYAGLRQRLNLVPRLLIVGKSLAPDLVTHMHRLNLSQDVIQVSNVSESQLQGLYSLADGLLFPSWHEGFGLPIAEAQACGCPVFTSNRPPMTEVGGDGAMYVDPGDPRGAAEQIAAIWPERTTIAARGLARAVEWDPRLMIDRYVSLYTRIAAPRSQAVAV